METHFIVHDKVDTVGVMVVENAVPGQELTGWIMETNETIAIKALDAVPLGHKIALKEINAGDTVLKYGHDVGRAVASNRQRQSRACSQHENEEVVTMGRYQFFGYRRETGVWAFAITW